MKQTKIAIYGCGTIAEVHAKAISEIPEAELFAVCDLNTKAAEAFAERHGTRTFADLDEMLLCDEVDAVSICTPNGTHAPLATRALLSGKHVILEKPMAISVVECDTIIDAARKSGRKITVISQMRTSPDVLRAKEIIDSGALGKIILSELNMRYFRPAEYFKGSWRGTKKMDGGGALMNQGVHGVDLLSYLMGEAKCVNSIVRTLFHDIEVEDAAVASVEFECGALGVITASTATHPGFDREIKIYGTRGALELREDKLVRLITDGKEHPCEKFVSVGGAKSNLLLDFAGHKRQISSFLSAIRGEDVTYVNEHDGRRAVSLIERIYKNSI